MSNKRPLQSPEKAPQKKVSVTESTTQDQAGASGRQSAQPPLEPPAWFTQVIDKFDRFESRFSQFENHVLGKLDEISLKSAENEEKITACTIQLEEIMSEVKKLKEEKLEMMSKLDDLENRSRRNNLVLHGVPEPEKGKEVCQEVVHSLFRDFVGLSANDYSIERCHRTPSKPAGVQQSQKPRIIHVAFSSYLGKERVRKACISKFKENVYKGQKIFVSEDFSKRVLQQRKEKLDELKRLRGEGKKPFFLFPARLAYRDGGGKLHLID